MDHIKDVAVKTASFVRSQVRKLDISDDDKLRVTIAATAMTASIFIEALSQLTDQSITQVELEFKSVLHEILTNREKTHVRN